MADRTALIAGLPTEALAILRGARLARGYATHDVARGVRCTRRYIEMIEDGTRCPTPITLEAIARFVGLDDDASKELLHALRGAVR